MFGSLRKIALHLSCGMIINLNRIIMTMWLGGHVSISIIINVLYFPYQLIIFSSLPFLSLLLSNPLFS